MSLQETGVERTRKPKLASVVAETLRQRIGAGEFLPGAKLPSEAKLTGVFGVSRTVIREAIAALAADGIVEPRQGAGLYVMANAASAFSALGVSGANKISVALNVLEVRMGIEIEASGLAAQRRSSSQEAEMRETFNEFGRLLESGTPTGRTDFDFHRAIAAATNNPFYLEVLEALGSRTIPCDVASPWGTESVLTYEYQVGLHEEHRSILSAICDQNEDAAREAMREHLSRSQQRYRQRLVEQN
jgi:GntR family transcriptional repressor for pyruvate dehydrogenase complex